MMEGDGRSLNARVRQFRKFCEDAARLLPVARPSAPVAEFQQFIGAAGPILAQSLGVRLDYALSTLSALKPWLLDDQHDLLHLAQITRAEDPYTELLAWAINPATDLAVGAECQKNWLLSLGVDDAGSIDAVIPSTQFATDDGIPDLVLHFPNLLVVVEAKTGSSEHVTPTSGQMQTVSYPSSVRRRLGKPRDFPTKMVFLTLDRSEATNGDAIRTSYFELAVSLARTLNDLDVPMDLAPLYGLIVNHFATKTGVRIGELKLLTESSPDAGQIIRHAKPLTQMLHLLPERAHH